MGYTMQWDWEGFLGRPDVLPDKTLATAAVQGKSILITGAGGSIGARVATVAMDGGPSTLLLLDSSEHSLYEIYREISAQTASTSTQVIPIVGSVADRRLLDLLFRRYHPDTIFHAAAYKHLSLMEQNPFSALSNNALGTYSLVRSALESRCSKLVLISTDKAVAPTSIMGVSKRIAEQIVLAHACSSLRMNAVRLGNVLGSSGSVVPLFQEQLEQGRPLTVTHPDARRYFLTSSEAGAAVLRASISDLSGRVLLADCGGSHKILDLAYYMADQYLRRSESKSELCPLVEFTALRPGEKLEESPYSSDEKIEEHLIAGMRVLNSPCPSTVDIASGMERLDVAIQKFDFDEMLAATSDLVPAYEPSRSLYSNLIPVGAQ